MNRFLTWTASLLAIGPCLSAMAADIDWSKVDQVLGKKGSDLPGGVHKYGAVAGLIAFPWLHPAWVMVK